MPLMPDTKQLLQREFDYYIAHQDDFIEKYEGKVIVLKGGEVLGVYESELDAVTEAKKTHDMGTFLVQKVTRGDADYTQHYHSRVVFQ